MIKSICYVPKMTICIPYVENHQHDMYEKLDISKLIKWDNITSILPVSGAPQLKTCGAQRERPIISHKYPYSRLESPAPSI